MEGSFRPSLDVRGYVSQIDPEGGLIRPESDETYSWGVTAQPFLWGAGEAECSTCTDLVPSPHVIFDANGYYRALGFSFPYLNITRKMLRLAFLEKGGEKSVWLTNALKVLLDPVERRKYDLTRLGDLYLDRFVQAWFRRKAHDEARRRNQKFGLRSTKEEVLDEWGLSSDTPTEPALDSVGAVGHDPSSPTDEGSPEPWEWSYYLWGSRSTDTTKLARWQRVLLLECIIRGLRMHFCVGFSSRRNHPRVVVGKVGSHLVIFLREDLEPSFELAAAAVDSVLIEHDDEVRKVAVHG
jgi:hypothetical protein